MKSVNLVEELKNRGLVQDISDEVELKTSLEKGSLGFYCGFDPTGDSLHVGHLLPLIALKKIASYGHNVIALLGSATGMIGDPSGKSEERNLVDIDVINHNSTEIEKQIKKFFDNSTDLKIVKNGDWLSQYSFIEVLRDTGKHFSVNQMIARDSVKSRLSQREQGISYTEFSYMLLQAIDFHHLFKTENCSVQIVGTDQWGNIASGIDLIRRKENGSKSFGVTIPLLVNSNGKKFGKTENGAVWLSEEKTSPYAFFQFWINTTDEDVFNHLRLFTDVPLTEISEIEEAHSKSPEKRIAQIRLAQEVSTLIHGKDKAVDAEKASQILFGNKDAVLTSEGLLLLRDEISTTAFLKNDFNEMGLPDFLVAVKASESKSSARKLIQNGGISINNKKHTDPTESISRSTFLDEKAMLLKVGKKNYFLCVLD